MIEISQFAKDEAKKVVLSKVELPAQVNGFPSYFVARLEDRTVLSYGSIEVYGILYKIGTKVTT
jgi:hypothetical protein